MSSGSLFVAGSDMSIFPNKIILAKLTANGDTVWTKRYGVNNKGAYAEYLNLSADGALVIAGDMQDW